MAIDPLDYNSAMRAGHLHAWEQDWADALVAYEQALRSRPSDYTALTSIGLVYLQKQNLPKALSYYRQASLIAPEAVGALGRLGFIYTELNQPAKAAEAYVALGRRYRQQGINNQALLSYLNAAEAEPTLISARQALCELYRASGNARNAASECLAVAHLQQQLGNTDAAHQAILQAQKLHPASKDVFIALNTLKTGGAVLPLPPVSRPSSVSGTQETTQLFGSPAEDQRLQSAATLPASPLDWALERALTRVSSSLLDMDTDNSLPDDIAQSEALLNQRALSNVLVRSLGQALDAYTRKDYEGAATGYQRARRAGAQHSALPLLLAAAQTELGQYDLALENFRSVLNRKRYAAGAYYGMAKAALALGDPYAALDYALSALSDIDLTTVSLETQSLVRLTYVDLIADVQRENTPTEAEQLTDQLLEFLSGPDWLHRVQQWRARLNTQTTPDAPPKILASVFFVI